jgi:nucleotide-binding universal stress UspA family protein
MAAHLPSKTVLLAVDDSEAAEKAVDFAILNLYKPGDEFHIVHVINETEELREYYREKELEEKATKFIQERFVPKLTAAGITVVVDVLRRPTEDSHPGAALVVHAHKVKAATTVLATHARDFGEALFHKSMIKYVLLHSQEPVTIVNGKMP